MWRKRLLAVIVSILLLSAGWLGLSGVTLFVAFVPLLWLVATYDGSMRSWWRIFGWALLAFVGWNAVTVWWIWNATPVGPFAATLASTFLNMLAFMTFVTIEKHAPRPLGYVALVAAWIATEYWYTIGEFSFPWLILGNGFSNDIKFVQWYEYTGVFGGSLWVLLANILVYEALRRRSRRMGLLSAATVVLPALLSVVIYVVRGSGDDLNRKVKIAVVQPNVDCYDKFHTDSGWQIDNLLSLASTLPSDVDFILMPETAIIPSMDESRIGNYAVVRRFADSIRARFPRATVISGAETHLFYDEGSKSATARRNARGNWYDSFNSAVKFTSNGVEGIYHKSRLVIGVEKMPSSWLFDLFEFLIIDLGGTTGQLGINDKADVFTGSDSTRIGPSICWEAVYGDFYGGFVREGAQVMGVVSNDGWWGNTPGHKRLFAFCRLRAVEHRRAIARSANTGISGFISARGDVIGTPMKWEARGVMVAKLPLRDEMTFYTRHGDYIGRISVYVLLLTVLSFAVYRVKRRHHLM